MKDFEGREGIVSEATFDGKGISQVIVISLDAASAWDLQQLGFISSNQTDIISLKQSIQGFEADGMTCETETFGITASDEKSTEE